MHINLEFKKLNTSCHILLEDAASLLASGLVP